MSNDDTTAKQPSTFQYAPADEPVVSPHGYDAGVYPPPATDEKEGAK